MNVFQCLVIQYIDVPLQKAVDRRKEKQQIKTHNEFQF